MKFKVNVTQTSDCEYIIEAPDEDALKKHMKAQEDGFFEDWGFESYTYDVSFRPARDSESVDWSVDELGESFL